MEPGKLRHRIVIQRAVAGRSAKGGPIESYEDFLACWAEVLHLTPRETWQAQQVSSAVNMKVRIRYRRGLDAKMRIKWRKLPGSPLQHEYLEVEGPPVEVEGQRDEIWLMCIKRDSEGYRTGDTTEQFRIQTESGDTLITESGDTLVSEDSP